ncbi:hypothetical protein [Clostridium butyricum]|uniref:hypothetical protein n=1 Tax=Clostridium butyricum TaxID=1492 RepID=UPI00325AE2F7
MYLTNKNVMEMIENCESGMLLTTQNEEALFFEDDYDKLRNLVNKAENITYNRKDKENDYKIKKVYFTLNHGQATLEIL